jgi:hypothetical protein
MVCRVPALALLMTMSSPGFAATIFVPEDFPTVHQALKAANDAGGDVISVGGTYIGDSRIVEVNKPVRIEGRGSKVESPMIVVLSDGVEIFNMSFSKANNLDYYFGSSRFNTCLIGVVDSSLLLESSEMRPTAVNGICALNSEVTLTNVSMTGEGGQRWVNIVNSSLYTTSSVFRDGKAGSVWLNESDWISEGDTITSSFAYGDGGAIHLSSNSSLQGTGMIFEGTTSLGDGGAIYVKDSSVTLADTSFYQFSAGVLGGAIYGENASIHLSDVQFQAENDASTIISGGIIAASKSEIYADSVINSGGGAVDTGGAWSVKGSDLTLTNVTFERSIENRIPRAGGALYMEVGTLWAEGTVFRDTHMDGGVGAALALNGTSATIGADSEVYNTAAQLGAVAHLENGAVLVLEQMHIAETVAEQGAVVYSDQSRVEMYEVMVESLAVEAGGLVYSVGGEAFLEDVVLQEAQADAGLVATASNDSVLHLSGLRMVRSEVSGLGGILNLMNSSLTIQNSWLCARVSEELGSVIFGVELYSVDINNSVFMNPRSSDGQGIVLSGDSMMATLFNNNFLDVGSDFVVTGIIADILVVNNIFSGLARANFKTSMIADLDYNHWSRNIGWSDDTSDAGSHDLYGQPGFYDATWEDCSPNLWLRPRASARDSGSPDYLDLDGSRSDMGAFGGLDSSLDDVDLDGSLEDVDCDDTNPNIFPSAVETPGDGIDQDCDGLDWTSYFTGGGLCSIQPKASWFWGVMLVALLPLRRQRRWAPATSKR